MKTLRRSLASFLFLTLILFGLEVASAGQQKKRDTQSSPPDAAVSAEEAAQLEAVVTTDLGVIRFEFFPNKALKHSQQFVKLARAGFYDGSAFHRVIQRGLIQGGVELQPR